MDPLADLHALTFDAALAASPDADLYYPHRILGRMLDAAGIPVDDGSDTSIRTAKYRRYALACLDAIDKPDGKLHRLTDEQADLLDGWVDEFRVSYLAADQEIRRRLDAAR